MLAMMLQIISEHVAWLKVAISRYGICSPQFIFIVDESGVSFWNMAGRSARKCIGYRNQRPVATVGHTHGNLDCITIMGLVNAISQGFRTLIVLPGKNPHNSKVSNGTLKTVNDFLTPSYAHYRDLPDIDTSIFRD